MDSSAQRPLQVCSRCGGSGMLRLGDQSFRTCLDCLGQGRLQSLTEAATTAAAAQVVVAEAEVVQVAARREAAGKEAVVVGNPAGAVCGHQLTADAALQEGQATATAA
jgi:DnaJ-class molecular chaperone